MSLFTILENTDFDYYIFYFKMPKNMSRNKLCM